MSKQPLKESEVVHLLDEMRQRIYDYGDKVIAIEKSHDSATRRFLGIESEKMLNEIVQMYRKELVS